MKADKIRDWVELIAFHNDQQAFKRLFWLYYDPLFHFSNSIVKCKEAAEEIVEDVFVAIWKNRGKLPEVGNLKVYLYVSVKNYSINYLRRSKPDYSLNMDNLDVSLLGSMPTPEEIIMASEMKKAIEAAVLELPPKCRMVYKLVKEDGLCHKEVAKIMEISPRTVEHHVASALRSIANHIHIRLKTNRPEHRKNHQLK